MKKIAALKERIQNETRVAITPETTKIYKKLGFNVCLEKGIGLNANFTDTEYEAAGAQISHVPLEILGDADIVLKVQPSPVGDSLTEMELAREGALIVGMFSPYQNQQLIQHYANKKISLMAMELIPRTTKAQAMDVLSSQANLAGYRAVIEAVYHYNCATPMFMTAAGTVTPAKVLILGTGVAGLQAIATARRLGAVVFAYDVRTTAKEQVESLGAKFIHPSTNADFSSEGGYAKEVTADFARQQEEMLLNEISKFNIIITTAQIPGRPAPKLITEAMIKKLKPGTVIVDMATSSGGNCALSKLDQIVEINGVKIIGFSNFAAKVSQDASKLYAKNLANLIQYLFIKNDVLDLNDDIVAAITLCHQGKLLWPRG